jgi:hypothetical protein
VCKAQRVVCIQYDTCSRSVALPVAVESGVCDTVHSSVSAQTTPESVRPFLSLTTKRHPAAG